MCGRPSIFASGVAFELSLWTCTTVLGVKLQYESQGTNRLSFCGVRGMETVKAAPFGWRRVYSRPCHWRGSRRSLSAKAQLSWKLQTCLSSLPFSSTNNAVKHLIFRMLTRSMMATILLAAVHNGALNSSSSSFRSIAWYRSLHPPVEM